jgi:hypothetical protein
MMQSNQKAVLAKFPGETGLTMLMPSRFRIANQNLPASPTSFRLLKREQDYLRDAFASQNCKSKSRPCEFPGETGLTTLMPSRPRIANENPTALNALPSFLLV